MGREGLTHPEPTAFSSDSYNHLMCVHKSHHPKHVAMGVV